tara:strand:- start:458 stop:685 length:228 start_codon:yes stop_codon:yes gene_type:complete
MPLAHDIFERLMKDPDLDIGASQTRESAAKSEANFQARQHFNNVQALSLASEPLKKMSPLEKLVFHVSKLNKEYV